MMKKERGITLIALIITIIVILILVAVTVMAVANSGLFDHAKDATKKWGDAQASESNLSIDDEIKKYTDMTLLEMFEKAQADGCINEDGTCARQDHLHIGDFVNYNPGANGSESYTSSGDKTGMNDYEWAEDEEKNQIFQLDASRTWRVLGTEGEGANKHVILISGDPLKKQTANNDPYYYLYGATGCVNGEEEINNICKMYGKGAGATGARAMKIEDVNNALGVSPFPRSETEYSITQVYSTPEQYLASVKSNITIKETGYGYDIITSGYSNRLLSTLLLSDPNTAYSKSYWLISDTYTVNNVYNYSTSSYITKLYYGLGHTGYSGYSNRGTIRVSSDSSLFVTWNEGNVDEHYERYAIRPIVALEHGVTTQTINKIPDQPLENWMSYSGSIPPSPPV